MKKIRKSLCCILCAVLLCCGCGAEKEMDDMATNKGYEIAATPGADNTGAQDQKGSEKAIPKEKIKIGVLHISDPAEGSGYTYTHDLGIQGMQQNLGLNADQIVRKINVNDGDSEAAKAAIKECIDEGCNVIFTTSWGYMDPTEEMAKEYPEVYFCHGTGYKSNGTNFTNYFGRIYQARYLSGIVAGMNTTSNKIGYVAAMDSSNSEVTGGIDAFAMGVASVNPEARVYVKVTNSWFDPEAEAAAASKLLSMGCDVITQHCDTAFPQTLAQDAGVYGIGYNSDMRKEAPNACLTSVIWNWSAYYTYAVQSIIDGTWTGQNYYGGMVDGLVDITGLADFCAAGTKEKVEEARAKIISGTFNVFDGEIETNTGEIIGMPDSTLDDGTITGGINWYYKNVVVVE